MNSLLIDNFSEGMDSILLDSGEIYRLQNGTSILGGKRQTYLKIFSSPYNQRSGTALQISAGHLIMDTGAKVQRGFQIGYGLDHTLPSKYFRLDLDLSPYSLFRINFLFSDGSSPDGFNVQFSSAAGDPPGRLSEGAVFQAGRLLPVNIVNAFQVDLRFEDFRSTQVGFNLLEAVRTKKMKIDTINLLFAGTSIGASNFVINSIEFV